LALATFFAMLIARAVDDQPIVIAQAAVSAVLITTFASQKQGWERLVDALIGVGVGLVFSQLLFVPEPLRLLRRAESAVLSGLADGLSLTADAVQHKNHQLADQAIHSKGGPESRCGAVRSTRWARWQRQPSTLAVGSTRLMPSLVTSLRETANVGSLAGMLHRVADHADQPDCGGHRGIPAGVDDPIQLLGSKAIQVAQRQLVDIAVILAEQVATHADRRYLLRALAITGSPLVKRQPKPFPPLRPHLLNVRQVGDLMVLAAG
jgi:hypothetical protein